ncbi:Hypothetical protein R9X50_00643900 [Acrodontium crateriforme]|uniref:Ubiquitin-like domain-containing protein n=1 Tax=Acrodontium crateriforme TaxID=150365 RepID=A0AAQ3MA26_9PEZI|nr:Hypothetical protein R9X50_00643900 [Acrodontium crateriforme]
MAPSEPPSTIFLRLKVPHGTLPGTDEFDIGDTPTSHTIATLHDTIQLKFPGNPAPARQRLLYGGRALADANQSLADALNTKRDPTQTNYVIHLLVRSEQPFHETVGMRQQERAAAGMQGVGGHVGPTAGRGTPLPTAATASQIPTGEAQATAVDGEGPRAGNHGIPQFHNQAPPRPSSSGYHVQGIGPSGQRFQIHHQQVNFPSGTRLGFPNQGFPAQTPLPPFAQMPTHQGPPSNAVPSALDRARENMTEMRRMLDEMRNTGTASEEQLRRITELEQRAQRLNEYIDPLGLGTTANPTSRAPAPLGLMGFPVGMPHPFAQPAPLGAAMRLPGMSLPGMNVPMPAPVTQPSARPAILRPTPTPDDVTCWLVSSPQGPQALIYSPRHGQYLTHTGPNDFFRMPATRYRAHISQAPTPTQIRTPAVGTPMPQNQQQNFAAGGVDGLPALAAGAAAAQPPALPGAAMEAQAGAPQAIPGGLQPVPNVEGAMQGLMNHFWLLLRVLIFAYFLMGANMGWRRPVALAMIGLGFWLVRLGLFGQGGVLRRWWDGIIDARRPEAVANAGPGALPAAANAGPDVAEQRQQPRPFPTPEELANRILAQQREAREANSAAHRFREMIRPAERAGALFIASLWPGVGEAHVQAREAEERRIAEEEAARRRAEDEERARIAAEAQAESEKEKLKGEEHGLVEGGDEKNGDEGASENIQPDGHIVAQQDDQSGSGEQVVNQGFEHP